MKWKNKGHEFDELGARLKNIGSVYLFGAGVNGKTAYEKYYKKIDIKGFIDNSREKQAGTFCELPVFAPADIKLSENEAIVITTQPSLTDGVMEQLKSMCFTDNVFSMQIFFPVFDYYKFGELCLSSVSFLPTTMCNLKCKHCLNFSPYIKKHQIRSIEQLKADLDLLFSKIDTLLLLHISGGEPFTYPYLDELINYVAQNFGSKLGRLEMTTNGTIIPSEKLLACIRDFGLHLIIDDYREALQQYRDKHNYLLSKLNEYSISYQILKADFWVDLAPFDTDHSGLSEEQLRRHFEICSVPWQEYRNGKLYLCNYAAYAEIAGIVEKLPSNDYMDLNKINDGNKAELLEFRLGYSENGYTEFCKRCSGYHNNPYKVSAAEQI